MMVLRYFIRQYSRNFWEVIFLIFNIKFIYLFYVRLWEAMSVWAHVWRLESNLLM